MKIMVVGGGGREHAIIKKIKENKEVTEIFALPGNGGMAKDATLVDIGAKDIEKIVEFAVENSIDYAVVAPDDPLVLGCVDALEEKGYIVRDPMLKRSIRIVGQAENVRHVPLLGTVTAGLPILAVEQVECYLPFTGGHLSKDKELFALRVRGESMINAGIYDGDILFVEKTPAARNGDIVVALIEDEATVKTFYKENGHFRLQPENDAFEPIIVNELIILGKAVAMMRYL